MASQSPITDLFGGDKPWSPLDWTSSDDCVRGGSSYSRLRCHPSSPTARFQGNLDIKTLGGAGFASQHTSSEDRNWDLSKYVGLLVDVKEADNKQYTIILKDELFPKSPNGREQSTINWEYNFKAKQDEQKVLVRWEDLKPTYRGREKKDAEPLDLKNIRRIGLMMRSFFGTQEGDFSLTVTSISAVEKSEKRSFERYRDDPDGESAPKCLSEKSDFNSNKTQQGWVNGYLAPVLHPGYHKHSPIQSTSA